MNPLGVVVAACVVLAAIGCVSARRPGIVAIGAAVLLGGVALLGEPRPTDLVLLERAVGAALAGELLWLGLRGRVLRGASALGWPALALVAAAAFAAGVAAQRLVPGSGSPEALGTALALFVVAAAAVAGRPDGVHLGVAGLVAVAGTSVVRLALSGPTSALETLLVAAVGVAVAGAIVLLVPQVVTPARAIAPPEAVTIVAEETALARAREARRRRGALLERSLPAIRPEPSSLPAPEARREPPEREAPEGVLWSDDDLRTPVRPPDDHR
jgi:hypothetical protein